MKVLFLKHVVNVWKEWEIKEVKPGYAVNLLFPQWLAVELTPEAEKKYKDKLKKQEIHKRELVENRHNISDRLNWQKLVFTLKTGANKKVYWGIWEKDIILEIKRKYKVELSKKHIDLPDWHIKKLWETQIYIKLWKDSMAKLFITVNEE